MYAPLTLPPRKYCPNVPTTKQLAFLLCPRLECFFGGAAGPGKTEALLMSALQYVDHPHYRALLLRRTFRQLNQSNSIMNRARQQLANTTAAICGGSSTHPFLWESGGPVIDLNTLILPSSGATLYEADNINERGEIIALGLPAGCADPNSCGHIYLLIPKN
jgi:hypothetical protein